MCLAPKYISYPFHGRPHPEVKIKLFVVGLAMLCGSDMCCSRVYSIEKMKGHYVTNVENRAILKPWQRHKHRTLLL